MRLVIAGGGTGGHLFPGMAIAEAFMGRDMGNEVLFIGTERGIEARVLRGGKFPLRTIQARPLKGSSLVGKSEALRSIPLAITEAYSILKQFRPQFVLGVGGYASGPTLMAAFFLGMKRAIHEQNVIPGMTNHILKWFSQRIFISFEDTEQYFPKGKSIVTGNPVRSDILSCLPIGKTSLTEERDGAGERKHDRFDLFVFGGSAGAHRINEAMLEALGLLQRIRSSLRIIHQTGDEDVDLVSKTYKEKGFNAVVKPFFREMAEYYTIADIVICRSGASTVAELAVCGKAAILIPYPHAAHNHQYINAQKLLDLGAAQMIRDEQLNGSSLGQMILELHEHPEKRARMEESIRQLGRPRAAEEIVDHCYALIRG